MQLTRAKQFSDKIIIVIIIVNMHRKWRLHKPRNVIVVERYLTVRQRLLSLLRVACTDHHRCLIDAIEAVAAVSRFLRI